MGFIEHFKFNLLSSLYLNVELNEMWRLGACSAERKYVCVFVCVSVSGQHPKLLFWCGSKLPFGCGAFKWCIKWEIYEGTEYPFASWLWNFQGGPFAPLEKFAVEVLEKFPTVGSATSEEYTLFCSWAFKFWYES